MSQPFNIQELVNQRYNAYFLDAKSALEALQNEGKPALSLLEQEQTKSGRSLLWVEKQAIREKDLNNKQLLNYIAQLAQQLNQKVEVRLAEELQNTDNLYRKIIGIDDALPELLDLINVKAATISRIEGVAGCLPWFHQDIIKLVNQPKYRREAANGRVILVDSMRVALSRFGVENLNPVVLLLAFRRWLPQITDPYPQIKLHVWEEALATSIVSRKLAAVHQVNVNQAFALGMLHQVGTIAVVRLYFRLFDAVLRESLIEAQKEQQHEQHHALTYQVPSGMVLNQLIEKYALGVSAELISKMDLKRLYIANAMQEVASPEPLAEISPLALVLKQARSYSRYRILRQNNLLSVEHAKQFLMSTGLPADVLGILKGTDIKAIDLQVSEH